MLVSQEIHSRILSRNTTLTIYIILVLENGMECPHLYHPPKKKEIKKSWSTPIPRIHRSFAVSLSL
jgi:hypothetical protein